MPLDSDPILLGRRAPDDLTTVIVDVASHLQFKLLGLMFAVFIILNSDVFINRALSKFKGAVDYKCPTSWGVCIQGLFLVLAMVMIDALIRQKVI